MPDISKIQLPGSGGVYNIKDAVAREMISGGVSFIVAWDGTSAPDVASIPAGVEVKYNGVTYTGTLDADDSDVQAGAFYLVKSSTLTTGSPSDTYDEYVPVGTAGDRSWEKIGDTQIDLTNVVTNVTLTKQTDTVLGEDTTFTNSSSNVTFSGGSTANVLGASTTFNANQSSVTFTGGETDNVLGENTTFTTTVTPSTTYIGTTKTSDYFVTSVAAETDKKLQTTTITGTGGTATVSEVSKTDGANKLVTTTTPKITNIANITVPTVISNAVGTANKSTWDFSMGEGDASETLIISGNNGTDVTVTNTVFGTDTSASKITQDGNLTVATGSISAQGTGSDVLSGLSISPKTVAKVASQPTTVATGKTVASANEQEGDLIVTGVTVGDTALAITSVNLASNATAASDKIQVATGITNASTSANTSGAGSDVVSAVTNIGSGTAAAQTIVVGNNDRQTVVKTIGTATAAAQTITVGDNDEISVLTEQTSVTPVMGH